MTNLKDYLKRASELEGIIYSYEQTRALLQKTLQNEISKEAHEPGHYEYGDTIPWGHATPGSTMSESECSFYNRDRFMRDNPDFRDAYGVPSFLDPGHRPPNLYPKVKGGKPRNYFKPSVKDALLESIVRSIFMAILPAGVIAVVPRIFKPTPAGMGAAFIKWYIFSFIVLVICLYALNFTNQVEQSKEPSTQSYLKFKKLYEEKVDKRNAILENERAKEAYCKKALPELDPVEAEARQKLDELYAEGIVHPKYRNLVAMSQIYEYFDTGRCDKLEGPDGAYNLFEAELRSNIIIAQLSQIMQKLDDMRRTMSRIADILDNVNNTLSCISGELSSLESAVNVNTAAINDMNASMTYEIRRK